MLNLIRNLTRLACVSPIVLAAGLISGCGGDISPEAAAKKPSVQFATASGQVSLTPSTPRDVSTYAAVRFLDQASWGPTPQSINQVRQMGVQAFLDAQLQMPASTLTAPRFVIDFDMNNQPAGNLARGWPELRFFDLAMSGQDQLRLRVSWALFNFIPVSTEPYGRVVYFNLLQNHAFGSYKELLKAVSRDASMGLFLNNNQNMANRPNENFARELMQLFTVGLVMLNRDGSIRRDAAGRAIETYSQTDVVAATRALTGWDHVYEPDLPKSNWANFERPMQPRQQPQDAHDSGEKRLLGRVIPAGQTPERDLTSLIDILVEHPNTAPFVARRLIQHLVSSDPSPAYIARVATAFATSNANLGQTVRAVLLDPEARAADDPRMLSSSKTARMKEPLLYTTGVLRGLGCRAAVRDPYNPNWPLHPGQDRHWAPSVFGYIAPNHRAPESMVLAPEQRLLTPREFERRAGLLNGAIRNPGGRDAFLQAGCELSLFEAAARQSEEQLLSLISERFFRGAMPAPLQHGGRQLLQMGLSNQSDAQAVFGLLDALLMTPSYGVVK